MPERIVPNERKQVRLLFIIIIEEESALYNNRLNQNSEKEY